MLVQYLLKWILQLATLLNIGLLDVSFLSGTELGLFESFGVTLCRFLRLMKYYRGGIALLLVMGWSIMVVMVLFFVGVLSE